MKKYGLLLVLTFCLGMVGCGNDNEITTETETTTDTTTYAFEEDTNYINDNSEDYDYEVSASPQTDYYDMLKDEYDNNPLLYHFKQDVSSVEIDGKIYIYSNLTENGKNTWITYNLETHELSKNSLSNPRDCPVLFNNNIYLLNTDNELIKYDLDCNIIASINLGDNLGTEVTIRDIAENGTVIVNLISKTLVVNPDFTTVYELPQIEIEGDHGIMESYKTSGFMIYNNEIYSQVFGEDNIYKFNLEKQCWSDKLYPYDVDYTCHLIGKYAYVFRGEDIGFDIVDIENGTTIATINYAFTNYIPNYNIIDNYAYLVGEFARFYKYGKTHIFNNSNWETIRIYGDGSTSYTNYSTENSGIDTSDSIKYVINNEYYVVKDKYGFFLRTFAEGENVETDIERF